LREKHRLRAFENKVLSKTSHQKGRKTDHGKKMHNDELHNLYSSVNIVRVIKSRGMRWAAHVARMVEGRGV
jgi:hypothetical protein